MPSHGPKRIYTPQSLEFWFDRLEADWEGQFVPDHVQKGHEMYCNSEIKEIELGAKDAIIHRKIDKKEEYAVIEWDGDVMKVRSSSTDPLLAKAIAVAGLHEIEELVADEMTSKLPGVVPSLAPAMARNGNGASNGAKADDGPARDLLLSFTATAKV